MKRAPSLFFKKLLQWLVGIGVTCLLAFVGYGGFTLWSYAPWKTSFDLPAFDYSQDRSIDWKKELGSVVDSGEVDSDKVDSGNITDSGDWKQSRIITHAFGKIDQYTLTNSKEALVANYQRGIRVFEVDLILTQESRLVCAHDWKLFTKMTGTESKTFAVFMQADIYDRYMPISFRDVAFMMKHCPDVFIVTDTKKDWPHLVRKAFSALVADAKSVDETVLDRIIPQFYNPQMIEEIEKIYSFKEYIFTSYKRKTPVSRLMDLLEKYPNVTGFTFPKGKIPVEFCEYLHQRGVKTYTHTVNSVEEVKRYTDLGIDGFYSDELTDKDVLNLTEP